MALADDSTAKQQEHQAVSGNYLSEDPVMFRKD
jgi:hypothetical protein